MQPYGDMFRDLLAYAPDAVLVVREDGTIHDANGQAEEVFGLSRDELVGKPVEALMPEDRRERHRGHMKRYAERPRTRAMGEAIEIVGLRADGTTFPADIKLSPVETEQGRMVVGIVRDVTDRHHAQRRLQEYARTLAAANRELDDFAHTVAHDLKGPLKAVAQISIWLEEDLDGRLDEDVQEKLLLLRKRINRMEDFIEAMLDYARSGRRAGRAESVAVATLVRETIEGLAPPPTFRFELDSDLPTVSTDRIKLGQVFANLIGNAVKYHDSDDGTVRVSAREDGPFWEFAVSDDGPGIPPEAAERVFLMFERAAHDKEGSGVGLAIVKRIVETHGGVVALSPGSGRGTTFRFTWPKEPVADVRAA